MSIQQLEERLATLEQEMAQLEHVLADQCVENVELSISN
jgi:regulator of replication initiation timing